MNYYTEYLDSGIGADYQKLQDERHRQLQLISEARERDVLVMASDLDLDDSKIMINQSDILPVTDQLAVLTGNKLDLILETPGGIGEIAEQIVRIIRDRYDDVAVIVPGTAKSAGTIMAMSANDILMDGASALGPIDAQMSWQGKRFSAGALITGLEQIKQEATGSAGLNQAYIPMLQMISPGEIVGAQNALAFVEGLVADWLVEYKFRNWTEHSSTGAPVTDDEREERAKEIAEQLRDHSRWQTHGRSIRLKDLEGMRIKVTNFGLDGRIAEPIRRYNALLHMTFDTPVYKVFETPTTVIARLDQQVVQPAAAQQVRAAQADFPCPACKQPFRVQLDFEPGVDLESGSIRYPMGDHVACPECDADCNLLPLRTSVQQQLGKQVHVEDES